MSDVWQGPGWWLASDGKWYPAEAESGAVFDGDIEDSSTDQVGDAVAAETGDAEIVEAEAEADAEAVELEEVEPEPSTKGGWQTDDGDNGDAAPDEGWSSGFGASSAAVVAETPAVEATEVITTFSEPVTVADIGVTDMASPDVEIPEVEIPDAAIPEIEIPDAGSVDVAEIPDVAGIEIPDAPDVPGIEIPDAPDVPGIEIPDAPDVAGIEIPDAPDVAGIEIPDTPDIDNLAGIDIPDVPGIEIPDTPDVPEVEIPDFTIPDAPDIDDVAGIDIPDAPEVPEVEIPDFTTPDAPDVAGINIPDAPDVPDVEIPEFTIPDAPDVADVPAPANPFDRAPLLGAEAAASIPTSDLDVRKDVLLGDDDLTTKIPDPPAEQSPTIERSDAWRSPSGTDAAAGALGGDASTTSRPEVVDLAIPDKKPTAELPTSDRNWGLIGGGIAVIVLIAAIVWLASVLFSNGDSDETVSDDPEVSDTVEDDEEESTETDEDATDFVSAFDLRQGDCIVGDIAGQILEVERVDCADSHDFEVYVERLIDDSVATDYDETVITEFAESVCRSALAELVSPAENPSISFKFLQPTQDSWNSDAADRLVTCLGFDEEGPLEGRFDDE